MGDEHSRVWGIRSGEHHFDGDALFTRRNYIGVGWSDAGDLMDIPADREAIKAHLYRTHGKYPSVTDRMISTGCGTLLRFAHQAKVGDIVVYHSRDEGSIYVGRIASPYIFDSSLHPNVYHARKVEWLKVIQRERLSKRAQGQTGIRGQTFWEISYPDEFIEGLDL